MSASLEKTIYTLVITLVALAALPFVAHAITFEDLGSDEVVGDFVVGPGKIELELEPGESQTVNLLVSNRMGDDRIFKLGVEDVRGSNDPETTVVLLGNDRGPYSLKDYISLEQRSFELKHGTRAVVPVTVIVPLDAEPGGYYGSVLVSTASKPNDDTDSQGTTHIIARIGTLFFVRVPGGVAEEGKLVKFDTTTGKRFFTAGPINFGINFENTGSVHLNPYGEIRITNILGQEVGFVEAAPWFALPQSMRFREISWNKKHLFGYYTATASINRGYDNIVDTASVSFFVLPWLPIVIAFIALSVVFMGIRFIVRRFEFRRRDL